MNKKLETKTFDEVIRTLKDCVSSQSRLPKAICFDFFDTLVFRIVAPEQSKKLAARQLACVFGTLSAETIYEIRRELEKKLCQESSDDGRDPEFSLPVLAARIYQILVMTQGRTAWLKDEQSFVQCFCDIEIAVEKAIQRPYPEMAELLRWLRRHSVTLCLVSDFYLPQSYFEKLLSHHGLGELFNEIFVSADYGLSKASGKLYSTVCQTLGCLPGELWMVGDNPHSDKLMADQAGLTSFLVDVSEKTKFYHEWQEKQKDKSGASRELMAECEQIVANSNAQFFPEMATTLFLFTRSLFSHLQHMQVKDVFFCSKEGEFLKTLFDTYQEKMFGQQLISSHYLLVSRKATFICSLQPLEHETFSRLFDHYRDLTLEEFTLSLNFSVTQVETLKLKFECDWKERIQNLQHHERFKSLCEHPLFMEMYEQHREEQLKSFLMYIDSFGVDIQRDGLHTVDVGWKGSIQNNIYYALGENVSVHGCFLGLLTPTAVTEKNQKNGLVFCDSPEHTPYIHVYNNNRSLFEMMLGASHGSADGYFTEKEYQAVAAERSSTVQQWVAGEEKVGVTVLDLPEERELFDRNIRPLQSAFLNMFKRLTETLMVADCSPPDLEWFAKRHARMLFKPTLQEVDFFARLYHLENFGLFEFTSFDSDRTLPLKKRLQNLIELRKNPAAILETGIWQPIIFRRLGLSFLQPLDGTKRYRRIFKEQR